jgi:hypothetical protein
VAAVDTSPAGRTAFDGTGMSQLLDHLFRATEIVQTFVQSAEPEPDLITQREEEVEAEPAVAESFMAL